VSDEPKKGPVIWVLEITKVEPRFDEGATISFTIRDPITSELHEVDMVVPEEGVTKLRNALL
jgi:hypothetical protein